MCAAYFASIMKEQNDLSLSERSDKHCRGYGEAKQIARIVAPLGHRKMTGNVVRMRMMKLMKGHLPGGQGSKKRHNNYTTVNK